MVAPTGPVIVAEQLPDSNPTKKVSLAFRARYQKANNAPTTDAFSAYSFDAWLVFARCGQARAGTKASPARRRFARRCATRCGTKEVVGTHGIYNFKPGDFFGVDERARVLVQLQKGKWMLVR